METCGDMVLGRDVYLHNRLIFRFGLRRLTFSSSWLRLVFLIISSVLGFILYAILGGVSAGLNPAEETAIHTSFRNHLPALIGGLVAMSWYATWRLPEKIVEIRNRTQAPRIQIRSGDW